MNKSVMQGKWRRARGGLKSRWGELTDDDRRMLDGKIDQMVGLFQERYGYTQERANHMLARYLKKRGRRRMSRGAAPMRNWMLVVASMGLLTFFTAGAYALARLASSYRKEAGKEQIEQEAPASPEVQFD